MSLDDLRPILSGLVGGLVAVWLSRRLSRWIPDALHGKSAQLLTAENRLSIWLANAGSALGLLAALSLYQWGGFPDNDWRPLGLGFGFALASPLAVLPLAALSQGRGVKECLVAYAISQGIPVPVIYGLLMLGVPLLAISVGASF